jgi:hypothetical protein
MLSFSKTGINKLQAIGQNSRPLLKWSHLGAQPCPFICILPMAAFKLQWQSWTVFIETPKPPMFTLILYRNIYQPLSKRQLYHYRSPGSLWSDFHPSWGRSILLIFAFLQEGVLLGYRFSIVSTECPEWPSKFSALAGLTLMSSQL